jgi:catechol 2,3-dioxygenase-like lactoylglutathione lyase family enzyme
VAFARPEAVQIRSAAQPWDTGGLLSLMTRSNATDAVYRAAQRLGWSAYNDPVVLELRDAGVTLTNVILRGPDGVNVSVYERVAPRMPDEADLRRLRRPFNAMQSVRDIARARDFYQRVLGFELVNGGDFVNERREPNNFGMPADVVARHPIPFAIFGPRRDGPTQVELVELRGVQGRDLSARGVPPNLGLLALRFPVNRLAEVERRLAATGWPLERAATEAMLAPYGRVRLLAVRSPDGAWLEFFELLQE